MNAMPPPPTTALTDVIALFVYALFAAAILHFIRGRDPILRGEASGVLKWKSRGGTHASISDKSMASVRRFHKSMVAFALSWMPFLVLVAGNTSCSLLRDAGYQIIPWPLMIVSGAFSSAFAVSQMIRGRYIRHLLTEPVPAS
jgi:hypothetical protein